MASDDWEPRFPLRFDRHFQVLSYRLSHRELILRSRGETELRLTFVDTLGMKLKPGYRKLHIQ